MSFFKRKEKESQLIDTVLSGRITVTYIDEDSMFGDSYKVIKFLSFACFEDWIFKKIDPSQLSRAKFPDDKEKDLAFGFPESYNFVPICLITNCNGTLYSDGHCTEGKKFLSSTVANFCKRLNKRIEMVNVFVEE